MEITYDYSKTVEFLRYWYSLNARILPWRDDPKPYYIWISEIMLQQTRVEAVKRYFERFIEELPTLEALATVSEDKLLKLWEGLGYYNRARNLQKAAIIILKEYDGELPANYLELQRLPGIGSYTAGAIASIAFGIPAPAVDGNVLRVMKRVAGSYDDITLPIVKKQLEYDLLAIIPQEDPGVYNQAIMELGATICLPNGKPLCSQCPLSHICHAFQQGIELQIPIKTKKKARRIEEHTVLVLEYENKYALIKRENKGLLAGMWELPNIEGKLSTLQVEHLLNTEAIEPLGEAKHIFTHIEWHMLGYYAKLKQIDDTYTYKTLNEIKNECSIPSAFAAYLKRIIEGQKPV